MKRILLAIVIITITPICLNWIVSTTTPWNISIAGDMSDWIGFYGSYIGGMLAAAISFFILIYSLKHNRNENIIDRKRQDIKELKQILSERYSKLSYTRIINIASNLNNNQSNDELLLLESYYEELDVYRHSFQIIYEDSKEGHVIDFVKRYNSCIISLRSDIQAISKLIRKLPERISDSEEVFLENRNQELYLKRSQKSISIQEENEHVDVKKKLESIPIRIQTIKKIEQYFTVIHSDQSKFLPPVFNAVRKWIEAEVKELNDIESKSLLYLSLKDVSHEE
jgi:hypothetical protein